MGLDDNPPRIWRLRPVNESSTGVAAKGGVELPVRTGGKKCVRTVRAPCSLIVWFLEVFLSGRSFGAVARRGWDEDQGREAGR